MSFSATSLHLDIKRHVRYFAACVRQIPTAFQSLDPNRQTLLFFCVAGLDTLNALDKIPDKKAVIDWIYAQQVLPRNEHAATHAGHAGFRGGPFLGTPFDSSCMTGTPSAMIDHDEGHIAMTYTALCVLAILDDDFSRVDKDAILTALAMWQQENGSFASCLNSGECDMRFVYCAAAITHMLGSTRSIDVDKSVAYINASMSYDGGIGQGPGLEGHGGSTYCALAALSLWNRLDDLHRRPDLERWLISRQVSGFQGRPGKAPDTCYSWWVGASLTILGHRDWISADDTTAFTLSCQDMERGGFGKHADSHPDPLHSFFGIAGLSLVGHKDLAVMSPHLAITQRAAARFTSG